MAADATSIPGSERVIFVRNQGEELVSGFLSLPESPEHCTGDGSRMLFFNSTHHHAKVPGFTNHPDTERIKHLLQRVSDLLRQPLLQLKPAGIGIDNTRN